MSDLSVIMPLFNAGRWVGEAIETVLERADGLLELIVIDDGSTDDGPAIVRAFGDPVRMLSQPGNTGPSAARNAGAGSARGDVLGFLDADDVWLARAPDPRRAHLDEAELVTGMVQCLDADGRPVGEPGYTMAMSAMLMRRALWERHGGLDSAIVHAEDIDWLLRLSEGGVRVAKTPQVVYGARRRPGSLTNDLMATRRGMTGVIAASLRRRGVLGGDPA